DAEASIGSTDTTKRTVNADGDLTVHASDTAAINAKSKLAAIATTAQDVGLGLLMQALIDNHGIDFTDRSGTQTVANGKYVYIDDADYSSDEYVDEVTKGQRVRLDYDKNGFSAGDVLEYISNTGLSDGVDLDTQDYSDSAKWRKVKGKAGEVYRYDGTTGSIDLTTADFNNTSNWTKVSSLAPSDIIPGLTLNPASSSAMAFGILVVRNDVRSDVDAFLDTVNAAVGGNVMIAADESATINAVENSKVVAKGGSFTGQGPSVAVNGVVATNLVKSSADAYAKDSDLTVTGGVTIQAENESSIRSLIRSSIDSAGVGVGVTLAFNTVGWDAQNFLFNTVDAIAGNVLGTKSPATTKAWTSGTKINADGAIKVTATSDAFIDARIAASNSSITVAPGGGSKNINVGLILALNKVATQVEAKLAGKLAAGSVDVHATDKSEIRSDVAASALSISVGSGNTVSVPVNIALSRNEIDQAVTAQLSGISSVTSGNAIVDGDVSVTATKQSKIDSKAAATAIAVSATAGSPVSVSGGGAIAFNTIVGSNNTSIVNSSLTTTSNGDVSVLAEDDSVINAVIRTTAASVAIGGGTSPAVALGLSVSMNEIGWNGSTPAFDYTNQASTASLPSDGLQPGKKVKVVDGPLIGRVFEYIGTAITTPADVKLGAQDYYDRRLWKPVGYTANGAQIHATIDNSTISAAGDLSVKADANQTISADVRANSLGLGVGAGTAVGVSAAGVYTSNKIKNDVLASVSGSSNITAASADIYAVDLSTINATAKTSTLAAALGPSVSVAASIGLTLAFNEISSVIDANISGSTLTTTGVNGDIKVRANDTATIGTEASSASAAAAIGEIGVAVSGAGAYASNVILSTTQAYVVNSTVTSADDFELSAKATGTIRANIKSVAAAVGGGLVGVGVAIGVGIAKNYIGFTASGDAASSQVLAYISGSALTAVGSFTQLARGISTISANVEAGAVAIAAGKFAVAGAGTGVSATNKIGQTIRAYIVNSTGAHINVRSGTMSAEDQSTITSTTAAVSMSAGIGIGGGISIAVSLAQNDITNTVESYVDNATIRTQSNFTSADGSQSIVAGKRVRLADNFSGSGKPGTVYEFKGNAVTHASAHEYDYTSTHAAAVPAIGDVVLVATGHSAGGNVGDVYEYLGVGHDYQSSDGSTSISSGDRVLVAAGYDSNKGLAGHVYEYIGNGNPTIDLATEDYKATSQWKDISVRTFTTEDYSDENLWKNVSKVGLNTGETVLVSTGHTAGGTVGTLYQYLGRTTKYSSTNGTRSLVTGDRVRVALAYDNTKAEPGAIYEYIGSNASVDLGTANYLDAATWKNVTTTDLTKENYSNTSVWQNISTLNLGTQNYLDSTKWKAIADSDGETFSVNSSETATIFATSAAASAAAGLGAVAGGGANSINTISPTTRSYVQSSTVRLSGDLNVTASVTPTVSTEVGTETLALGISLAAGGSVAEVTVNPTVSAFVTTSNVMAEDIDVKSSVTPKITSNAWGVNAGTLAVGVSKSTVNLSPVVSSTVGGTVNAVSLDVDAQTKLPSSDRSVTAGTTGSSGGLIGVDATRSEITHGGSVTSGLAASSTMNVSGTTNVTATSAATTMAMADSFAAGIIAVGVSYAKSTSNTTVTASVGNSASFTGGSLYVAATRDHNQFADNEAGGGGVAAGASATAITTQTGSVQATVGTSAVLTLTDTFDAGAISTSTLNGRVRTFSGGLLAGAGASISNTVNSPVTTSIGGSADIKAKNIVLDAGNAFRKPDLGTDNIRGTTGGLVSGANADSETKLTFDTKVDVAANAKLTGTASESAPGEVSLRAVNDIQAVDKVAFTTGGAISGAGAYSTVKTEQDKATVNIGSGAIVTNSGTILMSARGLGNVSTKSNVETYGAVAVAIAETESDLRPVNLVSIGTSAIVTALGDVLISAGTDTSFNRDQYTIAARTDSFAGAPIPLDKVDSDATLIQDNRITIDTGALVTSAGDLKLHAERLGLANMDSKAKAVNWASAASGAINSALGGSEQFDGTVTVDATGVVDIKGTARTGTRRNRTLTLGTAATTGDPSGWNTTTGNITAISNDSSLPLTQGKQLLQSGLIDQLNQARANKELYATTNPTMVAFYQSEIFRLEQELLSQGLAEIKGSGASATIVPKELYVMTATVDVARAQAGIIDVRGDALVGNGTIDAPRNASINITNHTPAQLVIKGLTIPEQTGGVYLNGAAVYNNAEITGFNITGQGTAQFGSITPSSSSSATAPVINITNTFDGSSYIGDGSVTYPSPDILVTGDIINYSGNLTAISEGNIVYRASVKAANITTIAGGSVFIDGVSTYSVGGDPYGKLKALGDGISQYNTAAALNTLTSAPTEVNLFGDTVIINAEYINLNGIIQSGKDTYSLTLPSSLNTTIQAIRNGSSTSRLTALGSVSNKDFKVFYDRVENKIVLREVRVSGGNVQLTGNLLSTGAGTIKVLDGYGSINVDNQTSYDISVERIDASQRGSGTLLLADKAKTAALAKWQTNSGTQSVTFGDTVLVLSGYSSGGVVDGVYRYIGADASLALGSQNYADTANWVKVAMTYTTGSGTKTVNPDDMVTVASGYTSGGVAGTVYKYVGTAASLNLGTQDYRQLDKWVPIPAATLYGHTPGAITPADTTYSPASNWRYGFSVGMRTATRTTTTYGTSGWLGIDALASDPDNIVSGPNTEVTSQPTLTPAGTYFFKAGSALGDYVYATQTYNTEPPRSYLKSQWSTSTWYGKKTYYQTWVEEKKQETVSTHTFRADRPITIDFIGNATGSVTVTSNSGGRILLAGPILNPSGTTTLTASAGIVQTSDDASVGGKTIVLSASNGAIQNVRTNLNDVGGVSVKATAANAISIDEQSGPLPIDEISSSNRMSVSVKAKTGLTRASGSTAAATVKGGSITLFTTSGGIGASDRAMLVDQGDQGTHVFKATATGDIFLEEVSGNLQVDSIESTTGDVSVTTSNGSITDANRIEQRDDRTRDQLLATVWGALNLTAGTGANGKITETLNTARDSHSRDYTTYWKWRNTTANPAVYDINSTISLTAEELAAYADFYTLDGQSKGLSGQALTDYVNSAIATLQTSRTTQYHSLHAEFAAYDRGGYTAGDLTDEFVENFEYTLSAEEDAALRASIKVWTEEELLFTIGAGLLKEVTDTQTTIEAPNIIGKNVRLETKGTSKNIGSYSNPVTIDVRPRPLTLTNEERITLASAERADVVFISGTKYTGAITFTADAVNGDTLTRTDGTNWSSNEFAAGKYIRIEGVSNNVTPARTYWKIASVSGSVLTLEKKGTVTAETGRTVTVSPVILDPLADGATVSFIEIAQRDDVDLTASGTIEAISTGVIFLGSEFDLQLKNISATSDVALKTAAAITNSAASAASVMLVADDLVLEAASGGIGTLALPLRLNLTTTGTLTARAKNGVYLVEDDGNMRVETVYSEQGNVQLTADDGSILDQLATDLVDVKAQSIILSAPNGDIGAAGNLLDTDQNSTGTIRADAKNIYLWESVGEMRIDDINAGTGDVVLKAHQNIIDADVTDPVAADVQGNNVTLTSLLGGIGGAGADLEIDSRRNSTGVVNFSGLFGSLYVQELLGDLYLDQVGTGSTAFAFITAAGGAIYDGRTDTTKKNITSGKVRLIANTAIGTSSAPIVSAISNVEGKSQSGSTYIENTGSLTVGGVVPGATVGMESTGNIRIVTHSPINVTLPIIAASDIQLLATEELAAGDDITITATGSVTTTGGKIQLLAGDDISIANSSSLSATDYIEIRSGYNDMDTNGSTISIGAAMTAPLIEVHGTEYVDTITLTSSATLSGILIAEGRGGADTISTAISNDASNPILIHGDSLSIDFTTATKTVNGITTASSGTGGVDQITNTGGMAVMIGGTGADTITGSSGIDLVLGDEGLVTITSGKVRHLESTGNAVGSGDTISAGGGTNSVIGGMGSDAITAGNGTNTILGDEGQIDFDAAGNVTLAESINPTRGSADTFTLGAGVYRVIAGAGDESIALGAGTNYVIGDAGRIVLNGDGTTTIESMSPAVSGNDSLTVTEGVNVLVGGSGQDTITVQAGSGGSATAIALGDNGSMTLAADGKLLSIASLLNDTNGATDTISLTSGTNAVIGGAGADQITAGGGTNTVIADDGQATFFADGSLKQIESTNLGTGANDKISLQNGTNTVIAGAGNDEVTLGGGTNFVLADEGEVTVLVDGSNVPTGTTEVTSLNASVGGVDVVQIGSGFNVVLGGAAGDTVTASGSAANAKAIVLGDNGKLTLSNSGTLLSAESTNYADGAADTISLTNGTNAVIGGAGADHITAGGGTNTVIADDGQAVFFTDGTLKQIESTNLGTGSNDVISLQDGTNTVIAGAGDDQVTLGGGTNFVLADEGKVTVLVNGSNVPTGTTEVTSLNASVGGADTVQIGSGYNVVLGGAAADTITVNGTGVGARGVVLGDNGKLTLANSGTLLSAESTDFASGAADQITLTDGTNAVIGGAGADHISAGGGTNTVIGDDGSITFFTNGDVKQIESINLGNGANDEITLQSGTNTVIAGAGSDLLTMGGGRNFVFGDEGRLQVMTDGQGNPTGTTEVTSLNGSVGGTETIQVGAGFNVVLGGAASDGITVNGNAVGARAVVLGDNGKLVLSNSGTLLSAESTDFASGDSDTVSLTSGTNAVIGGRGADVITAGGGTNTVLGDDGKATFFADGSIKTIESINLGNGANDQITLQNGLNTVIAGVGGDILSLGQGTNYVLADEGQMIVQTDGNGNPTGTTVLSSLNPSAGGQDAVTVGSGYNVIVGGADSDQVTVNGTTANARGIVLGDNGKMTMSNSGALLDIESTDFASGAADTITLTNGTNAVIGGSGADQITAGAGSNTVLGDDGKATFFANGDLKLIESINLGNGGNDIINLHDGTNSVIAGAGNDQVTMGLGTNFVLGDEGRREVLVDGNGTPTGQTQITTLNGLVGGTDNITVGSGYNVVTGGANSDTIAVNGATADARAVVLGDNGTILMTNSGLLLDINSTDFSGGAGDTITLTAGRNTVIGGAGADQVTATTGRNIVVGDDGHAVFVNGELSNIESTNLGSGGSDSITLQNGINTVIGGFGNDIIAANDGTNVIHGDEASATLFIDGLPQLLESSNTGVGGNDQITLGTGLNTVIGGFGADQVSVGAGTATIVGDDGRYSVTRIAGTSTVSSSFVETMADALGGNDTITANGASSIVMGGAGQDTITGTQPVSGPAPKFVVLGDSGRAEFNGAGQALEVFTKSANTGAVDTITLVNADDIVFGGDAGDTINAGGGNNIVVGDHGHATFDASGQLRLIYSTDTTSGGNDSISVSTGNDILIGGFGRETMTSTGGRDVLIGDSGRAEFNAAGQLLDAFSVSDADGDVDTINTGSDNDVIIGGTAGDSITDAGGNNIVLGDSGHATWDPTGILRDVYTTSNSIGGNDQISTGTGNDLIIGGAASDTITSTNGRNIVLGDNGQVLFDDQGRLISAVTQDVVNFGNDSVTLGAGNDIVLGGSGRDTIQGGNGNNVVLGDNGKAIFNTAGFLIDFDTTDPAEGDVDTITVGTGNDVVIGGAASDVITAVGGNNVLIGDNARIQSDVLGNLVSVDTKDPLVGGNDSITSGSGNDVILGGSGADTINDAGGRNIVAGDNAGATFDTNRQLRTITSTDTSFGGIDTITTGAGDDVIVGGSAGDRITAAGGNNIVLGDHGTATLDAAGVLRTISTTSPSIGGNDVITSGTGNDVVFGGVGADDITAS
ncbi:MAG: hypothetical protein JNM43_18495, partial [Planctomycetaceae bacterium]|nr:hypothetical protein [Planctomycetaceae bacterium]